MRRFHGLFFTMVLFGTVSLDAQTAPSPTAEIDALYPDLETLYRDLHRNPELGFQHEIDYKIFGDDMQFVEVELDPNEAIVAEAGGMMYMDDGVEMETIFGDGSQQQSGFLGALMGAGKRLLTGESLFMTVFSTGAARRSESHSALLMQRLQGDGWAFVHAGGTLQERVLAAGELIRVDTGCIVAMQPSGDNN